MVDPDGTLDALATLGLNSPSTPTQPLAAKTISSSLAPPPKEPLPEIPSASAASTTRVQAPPAGVKEIMREPGRGVVGLPFNRMRPSGEEAIVQK